MFGFLHWRSLFRRRRFEAAMDDEFAFHREARTNDLITEGVPPAEARRRAQLEFGAGERYREECREAHRVHWFDEISADIRFALRTFRRSPVFAATAIVSLALGIGANAFVFSVFNSLLLRPLPIEDPARVKFVETTSGPSHSFPTYLELRDHNSTFTGLAGYRIAPMSMDRTGSPERIWGLLATGNYFDMLGLKPVVGRFFHQEDDLKPGSSPYDVLSFSAWKVRFGGDPSIAGSVVHMNGLSYTILGVAPEGFHGTELLYWPDVWVPMMMEPQIEVGNPWLDNRKTWNTWIAGRLRPGVTTARATDDLNRIAADLGRRYPDPDQGMRLKLADLGLFGSSIRGPVRLFTAGLLILAGLVLLTACSNLAGLMLARATDRQRELAIRTSIGAARGRIIRQLLTETVLLSIFGGAAGFALAAFLSKLLRSMARTGGFPFADRDRAGLAGVGVYHVRRTRYWCSLRYRTGRSAVADRPKRIAKGWFGPRRPQATFSICPTRRFCVGGSSAVLCAGLFFYSFAQCAAARADHVHRFPAARCDNRRAGSGPGRISG